MKKILSTLLLLIATSAIAQTDSFVQLPPNSTGVKLRMRCNTIGANVVCSQGFFLDDGSGSGALGVSGNPVFTTFTNSTIAATQSGTWNLNNISGTISLPTGAASETTLAGIKTGTDRIPSSPATDRATAGAPFSMRLSDGSAFYKATTPADQQHAIIDSGTTTVTQSTGTNLHTVVDAAPTTAVTNSGLSSIPADPSREGGNLATIAGKDFATSAKQDTINASIGSIKTNTDPLLASGAGGYVRQDSTATIAKESGGNLATLTGKDFATSAKQDTLITNTTGLATSANQTNGNQKTQIVGAATPTTASFAATQNSTTLLAASSTRRYWQICNASIDVMLIKLGALASTESYTYKLPPSACRDSTTIAYTGQVDATWYPGTSGQAIVTELQP